MNKAETIIAVVEAFDEAERKSYENQLLKNQIGRMRVSYGNDETAEKSRWAMDIYEYGRREIYKKYAENYYSKNVEVREDDDGNKIVQTFEDWYKKRFDDFPDFMSKEDFLLEFDTELHRKYEQKRAEALKED